MFNNYRIMGVRIVTIVKTWMLSKSHFADGVHSGEGDWEVKPINQSDITEDLRRRVSFWQHELGTFSQIV